MGGDEWGTLDSLEEPVGVSVVCAFVLRESQAAQSGDGPLHRRQILTCPHTHTHTHTQNRLWSFHTRLDISTDSSDRGARTLNPSLTFPEVHGLEHVGLGDAVLLRGVEELGDLLHLLEGGGGALDLLHRLLGGEQTVDQFTQDLARKERNIQTWIL